MNNSPSILVKDLGRQAYEPVWQAMKDFTNHRSEDTADEIWLVEHDPVFTQGQAGKPEHILFPTTIPVVKSDRGGQVTYHAPGQVVLYLLIDIKRKGIHVKAFVSLIEQAIISMLADYGVHGTLKAGAPGVYVKDAKIASLGLRVRKGCTYHGLSLNVDMDLSPFKMINPCGYAGLQVTQLADLVRNKITMEDVQKQLVEKLLGALGSSEN